MGIYDRPYYSEERKRQLRLNFPRPRRMLLGLMAAHLLSFLVFSTESSGVWPWLPQAGLSHAGAEAFRWWQFAVYWLFYAPSESWWILAGDLLGLYLFASLVEQRYGSRAMMQMYLAAQLCGAAVYLIFSQLLGVQDPAFGPGAGVYGLIVVFGFLQANAVYWFLHGWVMVLILCLLHLLNLYGEQHYSAMLTVSGGMAGMLAFVAASPAVNRRLARAKRDKVRKEQEDLLNLNQNVDAILDKIKSSGMDSLTKAEKALLLKASKKYQKEGRGEPPDEAD